MPLCSSHRLSSDVEAGSSLLELTQLNLLLALLDDRTKLEIIARKLVDE
jgi:hypothetical protein